MKRRQFLSGALGAGLAIGMSGQLVAGQVPPPGRKMKMLVLGGTGFIGPPTVRYAVERGHEVTIFTRGRSSLDIPGVEQLVGDRNDDLSALRRRRWDVVLDNNARDYRWVKLSTEMLKDSAEHYVFISTISAYAGEATGYEYLDKPYAGDPITIDSPLAETPAGFSMGEELPYGPTKALSEKIVQEAFPDRNSIVRPGFIVGPGDPSDRFTYWPDRIDRGGEVLAPGDGRDPVQIIDVRDLMEFTVRLAESQTSGVFNGVGIGSPLSMAEMLYGIRAVTTSNIRFTWVPTDFLRENGVAPYTDMPIWIPGDPLSAVDNSHAQAAGLTFRPLAVTAADTLAWHRTRPEEAQQKLRIGIDPQRESEVLARWHAANA